MWRQAEVRVAAIFDVHGNLAALDAVLAALEKESPDAIVVGGDLAAGPQPLKTLERLYSLGDRALFVRGNTDRRLVEHFDGMERAPEERDAWDLRHEWAARQLSHDDRDFLAGLPPSITLPVDGLGDTFFCHASPRHDAEPITASTPEAELGEMLAGIAERTIVCGHTHAQFERLCGGTRVLNPGSVGLPRERRPGAYWALLDGKVSFRRTDYDVVGAAATIRATGFPGAHEVAEALLDPRRVGE